MSESIIPESGYIEFNVCQSNATGKGKNNQASLELKEDCLIETTGRVGVRVGPDALTETVYRMIEPHLFEITTKRVTKKFVKTQEMEEEDLTELFASKYYNFLRQKYRITKTEKMDKKKVSKKQNDYKPIDDESVAEIVDILQKAAGQFMEENYTITIDNISPEMLKEAKELLQTLNKNKDQLSVAAFNIQLHDLYTMIPRRIPNLKKYDVHSKNDFDQKLSDEQEMLEFLISQLQDKQVGPVAATQTVLEANNLVWRDVTEGEKEHLKKMMGNNRAQYIRAWRISNQATEKYLHHYCDNKDLTLENGGVKELFHGSKTQNFWSIITNGLWLNPETNGISICGKAFGHGIYFAPLAQKSIGYTSSYGSYWAKGTEGRGYLAVFEVATGEIYDIYGENKGVPDNYYELQQKHPGADCTWAFAKRDNTASYLQNEEVIVYTDGSTQKDSSKAEDERISQCSIKYLIEFDANARI